MEKRIIISKKYPDIRLRSIAEGDLEDLRAWKNGNKAGFFFQDHITSSMQRQWYENYLKEDNGYMFIAEECGGTAAGCPIGCMGYRFCGADKIDLYNIIRGRKSQIHQTMSSAMHMLLSAISHEAGDITCKVLNNNPALQWYFRMGFREKNHLGEYVLLMPPEEMLHADIGIQIIRGS